MKNMEKNLLVRSDCVVTPSRGDNVSAERYYESTETREDGDIPR